jgi:TonB family protein
MKSSGKYYKFCIHVFTLAALVGSLLMSGCGEQENQVFGVGDVDEAPHFEGGLGEYVATNLAYPDRAQKDSISGIVRVQFVVDEYGNTGQIEVTKALTPACDSAVVRLVRNMPEWEPATIDDFPVKVLVELPVSFEFDALKGWKSGQ